MADSPSLPGVQGWMDATGKPLPPQFFRFFRDLLRYLDQIGALEGDLSSILARLDALESGGGFTVQGLQSVVVQGTVAGGVVNLLLQGDKANPGEKFFYGTDEDGAKGWYERLLSTLADVDLTGLADGDAIVWDAGAGKFVPGDVGSTLFNYITTDGEPYATEDYADLYAGA